MSIKLIENIETDLKLSIEDVIHVLKTLRSDIDELKKQVKNAKSRDA